MFAKQRMLWEGKCGIFIRTKEILYLLYYFTLDNVKDERQYLRLFILYIDKC